MTKQAQLNAAYRSARENYLRNVRSMENRGYVFDKDPRPKIPKRITEGSIRNIERLNRNRYNRATRNGLRGEAAKRQERVEAKERARLHKQADEARVNIDQLAAAMLFQTEQADPGGSTERFFASLMADVEGIAKRAETDDAYAIMASDILTENWDEIQSALEIIALYKDVEDAPGDIVDRLVIIIRKAQGKSITQEDMRMVGTIGEDPDYYPKE